MLCCLSQKWKVTLRPYVMVYLKGKGYKIHPAASLLGLVSFWGAAKTAAHRQLPLKKPQNEPSSPNCAQKENPFSSLLPSSCTWPLLICLGVLHNCSQPHFPLLEPARKLLGSCLGCRHSGGLLPLPVLLFGPRGYYLTEQKVLLISHGLLWRGIMGVLALSSVQRVIKNLCAVHLLLQGSNQSSAGIRHPLNRGMLCLIEEGIIKQSPFAEDPYMSIPVDCLFSDSKAVKIELGTV